MGSHSRRSNKRNRNRDNPAHMLREAQEAARIEERRRKDRERQARYRARKSGASSTPNEPILTSSPLPTSVPSSPTLPSLPSPFSTPPSSPTLPFLPPPSSTPPSSPNLPSLPSPSSTHAITPLASSPMYRGGQTNIIVSTPSSIALGESFVRRLFFFNDMDLNFRNNNSRTHLYTCS